MSSLNLGRLLFFSGLLTALPYLFYMHNFKRGTPANLWIPAAGGLLTLAGLILLVKSQKEAAHKFKEAAKREAQKQIDRKREEKRRMASGGWGDWDQFTQIRQRNPQEIEFRKSTPPLLLIGLGLFFAGLDVAFFGIILPHLGWRSGLLMALSGVPVFFVGRGITINGTTQRITRWWGWIYKPLFSSKAGFSEYSTLEIRKKLGMKGGGNTGRIVRYPLRLVKKNQGSVLLKDCGSLEDAQELTDLVSGLTALPAQNLTGDSPKRKRKSEKERITVPAKASRGPKEMEDFVKEHMVEMAEGEFPDSRGLDWIIHGFQHKEDLTYAEVEPRPDEVGYSRFKFVLSSSPDGEVDVVGIYCFKDGRYSLLSSVSLLGRKLPKRLE